jgi:ADP-ribosylglycohydrolase
MKANTPKERAVGAIMGAFIGDALGVGPHWYYDLGQLKQDYGEWIDDYTSPKAGRYHAGLSAGENSQTGQVTGFLLESLSGMGNYNEADFCLRLDALLATLDGTPEAGRYTDAAMRDLWQARQAGKNWSQTGSFADTAEAAIRMPVLAARYRNDFKKLLECMRSNVRLTHRDPFIAGRSVAFGLVVAALINGDTLESASDTISEQAEAQGLSLSVPLTEIKAAGNSEVSFMMPFFNHNGPMKLPGMTPYESTHPGGSVVCSDWPAPWIFCCRQPTTFAHDSKMNSNCRCFRPSTAAATIWPGPV